MAAAVNICTLDGNFKEIYADKLENLIPDGVKLYNQIAFNKDSDALGNLYHQPVILQMEHGFTYGGTGGDAFALNTSIAGRTKDAQIQGHELVLRSVLSVKAASASMNSKGAFVKSTKYLVANMLRSFSRRIEVQLLYGKRGIGSVASRSGQILTLNGADWAPGIWAGSEEMIVDVYTCDNATLRTANLTISSVCFDCRTITMKAGACSVAACDIIYYKGAQGNEFDGLENIIRNTGTIFNINASSFQLWKGNLLANSGTARDLDFDLVAKGVTRLVEKGLTDQDLYLMVNPLQWDVLLSEQIAKRMFDSSYSTATYEEGSETIKFHSQNGTIKIIPSIFVKIGDAFLYSPDDLMRVGSTDITFKQPGFSGEFFRLLNDANGYELRAYTDQALFSAAPGRLALITDLTVPAAG
jgi:hypothetical protein